MLFLFYKISCVINLMRISRNKNTLTLVLTQISRLWWNYIPPIILWLFHVRFMFKYINQSVNTFFRWYDGVYKENLSVIYHRKCNSTEVCCYLAQFSPSTRLRLQWPLSQKCDTITTNIKTNQTCMFTDILKLN